MSIDERIGAVGLAGGSIGGVLARCRAQAEQRVKAALTKLAQAIEAARQAKAAIPAAPVADTTLAPRLRAEIRAQNGHIQALQAALERARQALAAYRSLHGLMRAPTTPPVLLNVLLLGLMVFVEAFANAAFFSNAHMVATPMAALLTSILISATNILACACAGFFIGRWVDYGHQTHAPNAPEFARPRQQAKRLRGVFITIMLGFHSTVGLVRSQETLEHIEHSFSAYQLLLTTPEAVFLVITGVCLSALAYHKGRTAFADPYPHYGAFQAAVEDAQTALEDEYTAVIADIEDVADDALDQINQTQATHIQAIQHYNQSIEATMAAHIRMDEVVSDAQSQLKTEIAHIIDCFQSSGGQMVADFDIDAFCTFEHADEIALPEALPDPSQADLTAAIHTAKAEALAALAALYGAHKTTPTGDIL